MSSLRDRLRRQLGDPASLKKPEPVPEEPAAPDPRSVTARLHRMLERGGTGRQAILRAGRRREALSAADGGATLGTPRFEPPRGPRRTDPARPPTSPPEVPRELRGDAGGAWFFGQARFGPGHLHGRVPLDRVLAVDGHGALLLSGDAALTEFDPCKAVFFDLETTGLMGGGGNLAFIVGVATVDPDGAVDLMQFTLREPADEPALLEAVRPLIEDAEVLVSFNGKSFDRHVLADRFVMNRMDPDPVLETPHLDLIHPARRLYKASRRGCGLGQLEERCLGVFREDDLPGSEAPAAWFAWLRTGDRKAVERVLDHNALDLLSLVALCAHLDRCVRAPGAALPEPSALAAAGRLLIERGAEERGEQVLQLLARGDALDPVVYGSLHVLADHYRRQGRHDEALPLWRRMRQAAGTADLRPWVAEAIALEHRLAKTDEALTLVDELLSKLDLLGSAAIVGDEELEALRHRRQRLARKAG